MLQTHFLSYHTIFYYQIRSMVGGLLKITVQLLHPIKTTTRRQQASDVSYLTDFDFLINDNKWDFVIHDINTGGGLSIKSVVFVFSS